MKGIIDRFEGEYAVIELEERRMKNVLKSVLPRGAKEGDVVEFQNGVYINQDETRKMEDEIKKLSEGLWES